MYIQRLAHTQATQSAVTVRHDHLPQNHNVWHYHEELEFIYIKRGAGTFFVGDCIQPFSDDFIVLIGSNTPHYWLFDEVYMHHDALASADIRVIHFHPEFLGPGFFTLPEASPLKHIYQKAERALVFQASDQFFTGFFETFHQKTPLQRLVALVTMLDYISGISPLTKLVSSTYQHPQQHEDYRRMNKIMEHIRLQYRSKIHLEEIAQLAGMTSNSFCRYFKQRTGKTFIQFVNEIRIGQACKLLTETRSSVKEICLECGFQNFVSFHKIFKSVTQVTPSAFRTMTQTND
ncbi:helix-turn-helix domain-containing protein [Sphingobacterium suaedae]|uniref:Helix-turn-helix domain-containing protein n=1 Tax=Sphingobacterium suaedae TaxID=1686402 RepID=A0ABW5KGY7_9SPHI